MIRKFSMATAVLVAATGSALAADLPSRRPPPPVFVPPPLFSWTGFYVGGEIGYGFDRQAAYLPGVGFLTSYGPTGVIGGAHVGYNYQINQFVLGLEGDVDGTSISRNVTTPIIGGPSYGTRIPIEGSVRGRIGYAWDRALFFATGGAAFSDIQNSYTGAAGGFVSNSTTRVGWTVGGGIEYAVTNNWSVRAEYRYSDLGRTSYFATPIAATIGTHLTENTVRVGFSYKFDMYAPPAPVVAKY